MKHKCVDKNLQENRNSNSSSNQMSDAGFKKLQIPQHITLNSQQTLTTTSS